MSEKTPTIEKSQEELMELSTIASQYIAKNEDTKLRRALKVKIEPQLIKAQKKYTIQREDICRKYAATGEVNGRKDIVLKGEKGEYLYEKGAQKTADDEINQLFSGESGILYKIIPFYTDPPEDLEVHEIIAFKGILIDPDHPMCSDEYLLNPPSKKEKSDTKENDSNELKK